MLEIFDAMRQVQSVFMHAIRPIIQEEGLSKTEMMILMAVYYKKAFRMSSLAKIADVPASTFTGIIDRLVSKNFLIRENDPDDRRSVLLQGTPELQERMGYLHGLFDKELEKIFKPVPPELVQQTIQNLNTIYEYIRQSKNCGHCEN